MCSINKENAPSNALKKTIGAFRLRIILNDYVNAEGKSVLKLQAFIHGKRVRIPLGIEIEPKKWNKEKQLIKGRGHGVYDLNLLIEKAKARANQIAIHFRLQDRTMSANMFVEEFTNPTPKTDFISYMKYKLDLAENYMTESTRKHKLSTYNRLKEFKNEILFPDITEELVKLFANWLKTQKKNAPNTIKGRLKHFKEFLNMAKKEGIRTPLDPTQIRGLNMTNKIIFLEETELRKITRYYDSEFCPQKYKNILQYFLFSCFTGIRFSDVGQISHQNIISNTLVFTPHKTRTSGKLLRIALNNNAKKYIRAFDDDRLFEKVITNEKTNLYLKEVALLLGINKKVSFHVARHTFSTTFIRFGGNVTVLQKLLGHSNIRETMMYVHINDEYMNEQIMLLDKI